MSNQGRLSLSTKDVVVVENFQGSATLFQEHSILRIKDLVAKLEAVCKQSGKMSPDEIALLFGNGVDCEVLQPGSADWQNGTMHLSLEFQPVAATPSATPELATPALAATALAATAIIAAAAVPAAAIAAEVAAEPSDAAASLFDEVPAAEASVEASVEATTLELDAEPVAIADISEIDFADLADQSAAPEAGLDALDQPDERAVEIDALLGESTAPVEIDAFADGFGESLLNDADLAAELEAASARDLGDFGLESAVEADPLADLDADLDADLMGDLDSTAAPDLSALNSPWDLTGDLDAMLLKNGHV
jgi:KGK domain